MRRVRGLSRAFTLIELLVVIAIISLLAAILFSVFASVRGKAREASCASNLRQLGQAVAMYAQDADDRFPYGGDPIDQNVPGSWADTKFAAAVATLKPLTDVLGSYVKDRQVWRCPSDTGFEYGGSNESIPLDTRPSSFEKYGTSYYYHTSFALYQNPFSEIHAWDKTSPHQERTASDIVYLYDGTGLWHGGYVLNTRRYGSLYVDGHVRTLSRADFQSAFSLQFHP